MSSLVENGMILAGGEMMGSLVRTSSVDEDARSRSGWQMERSKKLIVRE